MKSGFILLTLFFLCLFGFFPIVLAIPINGLSIWGQILELLNIQSKALLIWFIFSVVSISILIGIKLIKSRFINIGHLKILAKVFLPWVVFCVYLLTNYLFFSYNDVNQSSNINKIILLIVKGIVPAFFITVWILLNNKNNFEKIEKAIIGFGYIQIYFVIQSYLSGDVFRRMTILGLNPIWLARDLGISIFAALSILKNRIFKLATITLLFGGIILTRSRGPIIALVLTLFIVYSYELLLSKKYKQLAPSFIVVLCLVVILVVGVGMNDYFTRGYDNFFEEVNVSSRIRLYQSAWSDFLESPILGKGVGNYFHYGISYPHNIILELLAETGLVGLVLFVMALKPKNLAYFKNTFSVYMLFALITTMFSGDLEKNSYLVVFSILANSFHVMKGNCIKEEGVM